MTESLPDDPVVPVLDNSTKEEVGSSFSVRQTRTRKFVAWSGTREQLLRIYEMIQSCLQKIYVEDKDEVDRKSRYAREDALKAYEPFATVGGQGNLERSGDLRAILDGMDVREVEWVNMRNKTSAFSQGLVVSMSFPNEKHAQPKLVVSGSSPDWVIATFTSLSSQICKDVPRWSFLFNPFGPMLVIVPFLFGLVFAIYGLLPEDFSSDQVGLWFYLPAALVATFGNWACYAVIFGSLRRFELLEIGGKNSGRRLGAVILGVVGVLGLVIAVLQLV